MLADKMISIIVIVIIVNRLFILFDACQRIVLLFKLCGSI